MPHQHPPATGPRGFVVALKPPLNPAQYANKGKKAKAKKVGMCI